MDIAFVNGFEISEERDDAWIVLVNIIMLIVFVQSFLPLACHFIGTSNAHGGTTEQTQ